MAECSRPLNPFNDTTFFIKANNTVRTQAQFSPATCIIASKEAVDNAIELHETCILSKVSIAFLLA